jgi:hypothetical protein
VALLALLVRGRPCRAAYGLGIAYSLGFLLPLLTWSRVAGVDGWIILTVSESLLLALIGPFLDGRTVVGLALWVAYGLWFALAFALYGALVHALRRRGWPMVAAGIAPYVLVEWLQPQIFPLYAGNGLVAAPILAQAADLGGPLLLTALLAGANLVLFETVAWLDGRRAAPGTVWSTAAVVAGAVLF